MSCERTLMISSLVVMKPSDCLDYAGVQAWSLGALSHRMACLPRLMRVFAPANGEKCAQGDFAGLDKRDCLGDGEVGACKLSLERLPGRCHSSHARRTWWGRRFTRSLTQISQWLRPRHRAEPSHHASHARSSCAQSDQFPRAAAGEVRQAGLPRRGRPDDGIPRMDASDY
jgi:hypothetical protein